MRFASHRLSISRFLSTSLSHAHARIESPPPASSTLWFVKVVCTLFLHRSHSPAFFNPHYLRYNLNPSIAFAVVYHINTRLNRPDLAFRFFNYSRINLKLIHSHSTFDLLLRSLCKMGLHDSAGVVFECMRGDGLLPGSNGSVLDFVVSSFASVGRFRIAEEVLIARAEGMVVVSSFVCNGYLSVVMSRGRVDEGVEFFRNHVLRLRSLRPDTCSFNIVMKGLCRVGKVEVAFEFFDVMEGFGCRPDVVTHNTLVNGLCRVGEVERAEAWVREVGVRSGFSPDVVTYTSVISGYCRSGKMDAASALFDEMIGSGIRPNLFTFNAVIDGFGKKGEVGLAGKMYERMVSGGFNPDVVTFTSLIDGYCRHGELERGMNLWDEMNERKVTPNLFTFSVLISALCKENRLNEARDLLRQLKWREDIVPPPFIYNPVIDGFCKAGNVDEANAIVADMEAKGCVHDKMTFTILILGHCMKGRMLEAIGMYNKMLSVGCEPDNITISSLVSCLRKAGMALQANEIEQKALNRVNSSSSSPERKTSVRNNMKVKVAV